MNMKNIGLLLNTKNIYLFRSGRMIPKKAEFNDCPYRSAYPALEAALENRQLQPVIRDIVKK